MVLRALAGGAGGRASGLLLRFRARRASRAEPAAGAGRLRGGRAAARRRLVRGRCVAERHVGINVPLFSLRSERGWGIGELTDLAPFVRAGWPVPASIGCCSCRSARCSTDRPHPTRRRPRSRSIPSISMSRPRLISREPAAWRRCRPRAVRRWCARGARPSSTTRPCALAKTEALALAFARFMLDEWTSGTERARDLALYVDQERWWLDDYALHQALSRACTTARPGREWEPAVARSRRGRDSRRWTNVLAQLTLAEKYAQWLAERQWQEARQAARRAGVAHLRRSAVRGWHRQPGDLGAGARISCWTCRPACRPTRSATPARTGACPPTDGTRFGAGGYRWLRLRARRMAALFDGLRVDHTIGLYRTYGRPAGGRAVLHAVG